jgi:threonyl-tRNA synthetase
MESINFDTPEEKNIYRHSTAHIMAQAVKKLYPDAKLGIGPAIEDGFYYDFDLDHPFVPEDLEKIEEEMQKIIDQNLPFEREELSKKEAAKLFQSLGENYKLQLIEDIEDEKVTIYRQGDFTDLCRGPHLPSTGLIKAFKLLSVAGAYWKGDEHQPMLQRIYGTAFESQRSLEKHLYRLEEAAKRDHRKLGKKLDLFSLHDMIGAGLVLYHPKGAVLRFIIEDLLKKEHAKRNYQWVVSPHIMKTDIWKTSGHYQMNYPMYFFEIEGQEYGIKPMNCPAHILVYKSESRSYRDLPLRYFELGTVYRHERSGVLHGLLRVRGFTQDDAHIFCMPEQLEEEINQVLNFAFEMLNLFGFKEYEIMLSTRPEKYVGTPDNWDKATKALQMALENHGIKYEVDPGEGVFYGPKIDIKLKDALGRIWQGPTIQVDFNLPERFDLVYGASDNVQYRPVMIHRTVLGSLERFIGVLIEHYAGALPVWLAPVQVVVIPIADRHLDYAQTIHDKLKAADCRAELDSRSESVNKKIRDTQIQKVPYMLIVGDKEVEAQTLAVRDRNGNDRRDISIEQFIEELKKQDAEKTSEL